MLGLAVRLVLSISAVFTVLSGQPDMISNMMVRFVGDLLLLAFAAWAYRTLGRRNKKEAVS